MEKHYDKHYFFAEKYGGKRYKDSSGESRTFGYHAGGLWNFQKLLEKMGELLGRPQSILDIGAGCGGFVATCNKNEIEALGLEFSQYAVDNAILGGEKYLKLWNVEETPWPVDKRYDWVTAIDLFEHLFADKADEVIRECKRVAKRFIIAKICTAQQPHEVWSATRAPRKTVYAQARREGFEWLVVSGHLNSQFPDYWRKKFEDKEWQLRPDLSEKLKHDLQLPEDWRTTLILQKVPEAKPLPETFTQAWYDEEYFAGTEGGKSFHARDGRRDRWSYYNPNGYWEGCKPIVEAWKTMFNPENMLDVGCGRGQFVAAAREAGIEAYGFDYSKWAVGKGRYKDCKSDWLALHDATIPWEILSPKLCSGIYGPTFDLVVALDFFEHIYEENLDFVIDQMLGGAKKRVFLQIAVAGSGGLQGEREEGYILKKNKPIPLELEKSAVAGHVTLATENYWYDKFDREDWMPRRDMKQWFINLVGKKTLANWLQNSIIILERVEP